MTTSYAFPRLTREQEDEILKELNYSREQLENDKQLLRNWLNDQHHFPESRKKESDVFLVSFLVGCKGSIEKAKTKLDIYYSIRGHGDLFSKRSTLECFESADTFQLFMVLPKRTLEGRIVTIIALRTPDVNKYVQTDAFKRCYLCDEWKLRQGNGISKSEIYLLDAKDFSTAHSMQITLSLVKASITWIKDVCPSRLDKLVVFNAEPIIEKIFNTMIKPLLVEKLKKRCFVTSGNDLSKYIDNMDILPSTYGGKEMDSTSMAKEFSNLFKATSNDFLATLDEETDETKRPKIDGYSNNPHFGAFGSIKTLITD